MRMLERGRTKCITVGYKAHLRGGKNPTQLDQCGDPHVAVGFLWLFSIFHLAVLFEGEV